MNVRNFIKIVIFTLITGCNHPNEIPDDLKVKKLINLPEKEGSVKDVVSLNDYLISCGIESKVLNDSLSKLKIYNLKDYFLAFLSNENDSLLQGELIRIQDSNNYYFEIFTYDVKLNSEIKSEVLIEESDFLFPIKILYRKKDTFFVLITNKEKPNDFLYYLDSLMCNYTSGKSIIPDDIKKNFK